MEQQLTRRDLYFILACLAISALCLTVGIHYFYRAFPEASIDFKITRQQAQTQAASFLQERGLELENYRHSAVFSFDGRAKTFLERQLGLEGATAVIGDPVRLWRWNNRWVRELQKEEYRVHITTAGALVGFAHEIEEDAEGANLSEIEARYTAEQFLTSTLGREVAALEFVEAATTERKNRTDHTFTWKLRDFEIGEATYRIGIGIQGDQIGGFREYLKVPEAWTRDYEELTSKNQATGLIAGVFLVLTLLCMLVTFVHSARGHDVRWKTALIFGTIAFVLTLLDQLNSLPVTEHNYDTTDTFGSFLTEQLLFSVLGALGQGIYIAFLTAAAESIYRRAYGEQISIGEQFSFHGMRTKRFLMGTIVGLTMTAFLFAYQTVFYLVAEHFGAWSPADIPYSEMVNTYFPWIVVLLIGFLPAVSEEFISRAFSIPFLHKYLKSRWAAVVISALIWGFAHANYPQQPFFFRGIEVGIAGIIIGAVMLRWGIFPALVWHYTVDALLTALILLRSSNSYFVISAAVSAGIFLLPLLLALALYLRDRYFVDPVSMLNKSHSPPLPERELPQDVDISPEAQLLREMPEAVVGAYESLTRRRLFVAALVVAASLAVFLVDVEEPLDFIDYAVTAEVAEAIAVGHLEEAGIDVAAYQVVTTQHNQPDARAIKYIAERQPLSRIRQLYTEDMRASLWRTRFYRELHKEEYQVYVDPADSSIYTAVHILPEEAPGADLGEEEARAIAAAHMRAYGLDLATFELKEASSEKLQARRDHHFVWEAREGDPRNVGELKFRCAVKIAGDQPAHLRRYAKIPEAWEREREESNTLRAVLNGITIVVIVAVALHLIWLLIRQIRGPGITWKPALKLGALGCLVFMAKFLNDLPTFQSAYRTEISQNIFTILQAVGIFFAILGTGLMLVLALALATTLYPDWRQRLDLTRRAHLLRDAGLVAVLILVADKSFGHFTTFLREYFSTHLTSPNLAIVGGLDSFVPFLGGFTNSLLATVFAPMLAGIVVYYARQVLRTPAYVGLTLLGLSAVSAGADAHTSGEFWLAFGLSLLQIAYFALILYYLLRNNILAYALVAFASQTLSGSLKLVEQSAAVYQTNGWIWLGLSGLCLLAFAGQTWRQNRH